MVDEQVKSATVGHIKKELPRHVGQGGNKTVYRRNVEDFNCS